MGGRHARNIRRHVPGAGVSAVMDVDSARAGACAEAAGAAVFDDPVELISADLVDAVIIASPDHTHASLAIACLDHGKPALVEKPLAREVADAELVVERELSGGRRRLQVGFMRHYDPEHLAIRRAIDSGEIGRPLLFRGWHRNPHEDPPPSARHVLVGSAVHDLQSARWLLGEEIAEIHVRGVALHPERSTELNLQLITLSFDGGALATIEVARDTGFGYEVGVEVTGSSGIVSTPRHHGPIVRRAGEIRQGLDPDWLERFSEAYISEVRAWVASLAGAASPGPSVWDGYTTLVAALAGVESIDRGTPARLEPVERPALYDGDRT